MLNNKNEKNLEKKSQIKFPNSTASSSMLCKLNTTKKLTIANSIKQSK